MTKLKKWLRKLKVRLAIFILYLKLILHNNNISYYILKDSILKQPYMVEHNMA